MGRPKSRMSPQLKPKCYKVNIQRQPRGLSQMPSERLMRVCSFLPPERSTTCISKPRTSNLRF